MIHPTRIYRESRVQPALSQAPLLHTDAAHKRTGSAVKWASCASVPAYHLSNIFFSILGGNFQVVSVDRSILEVRTQFPGILSLGCGPVGIGPANQIHQWETLIQENKEGRCWVVWGIHPWEEGSLRGSWSYGSRRKRGPSESRWPRGAEIIGMSRPARSFQCRPSMFTSSADSSDLTQALCTFQPPFPNSAAAESSSRELSSLTQRALERCHF